MKKRLICALLLAALLAGLGAGCTAQTAQAYQVYYVSRNSDFDQGALVAESRTLPAVPQSEDPEIEGLLQLLLDGPSTETLGSPIPGGTALQGWSLRDGLLSIDFSWRYGSLSGVELTLADYSVALTLEQLPQVEQVDITVEGEDISYRSTADIQGEDAMLSIFRSQPVEKTVTLYFPRQDETGLGAEERTLEVTEDESLAMSLLAVLSHGPAGKDLREVLSEGEVLSAEVREGICYLNLAASFPELAAEETRADLLTLYGMVNTLCQLDNISAVRLLCEGETMTRYGAVALPEPLRKDLSYLS